MWTVVVWVSARCVPLHVHCVECFFPSGYTCCAYHICSHHCPLNFVCSWLSFCFSLCTCMTHIIRGFGSVCILVCPCVPRFCIIKSVLQSVYVTPDVRQVFQHIRAMWYICHMYTIPPIVALHLVHWVFSADKFLLYLFYYYQSGFHFLWNMWLLWQNVKCRTCSCNMLWCSTPHKTDCRSGCAIRLYTAADAFYTHLGLAAVIWHFLRCCCPHMPSSGEYLLVPLRSSCEYTWLISQPG
jgi:hypothetical protein